MKETEKEATWWKDFFETNLKIGPVTARSRARFRSLALRGTNFKDS